jgi:hypothetical protein
MAFGDLKGYSMTALWCFIAGCLNRSSLPPTTAAPAEYFAQGVRFNGVNTVMRTSPSGLANGRVGILSFWFKVRGDDLTTRRFLVSDSGTNKISHENTNKITIQWVSAAGTTLYFYQKTATFVSGGGGYGWCFALGI